MCVWSGEFHSLSLSNCAAFSPVAQQDQLLLFHVYSILFISIYHPLPAELTAHRVCSLVAKPESQLLSSTNLYVCGLPVSFMSEQLKRLFSRFGTIAEVCRPLSRVDVAVQHFIPLDSGVLGSRFEQWRNNRSKRCWLRALSTPRRCQMRMPYHERDCAEGTPESSRCEVCS